MPEDLFPRHGDPERSLVVRVDDEESLCRVLACPPEGARWIEAHCRLVEAPDRQATPIPVDFYLTDPAASFPRLYRLTRWQRQRPLRVTIPLLPGAQQALVVATSLGIPVRLAVRQPDGGDLRRLEAALTHYLRDPRVCEPVEFFHSILFALHRGVTASLWAILDDDPALRSVVDEAGRDVDASPSSDPSFVRRFQGELAESRSECCDCAFRSVCGGYFKWPKRDYDCAGVSALFARLRETAAELERDLTELRTRPVGGGQR
jgi:hypothetical protein